MFYEKNLETKEGKYPFYYSYTEMPNDDDMPVLHWHEDLEILYCSQGQAVLVYNREKMLLESGTIAVVPPNALHTLYSTQGCVRHCLLVGKRLLEQLRCTMLHFQPIIHSDSLAALFEQLQSEEMNKRPLYQEEEFALVMQLLVELCRSHTFVNGETLPVAEPKLQAVRKMITYIDQHFTHPISIDSICRGVGYSKSYVCHTFKEATGFTLVQHITAKRLNHAAALMRTQQYSITQCAYMSGFQSASYFSKLYKKEFGVAPSFALPAEWEAAQ